MPAIALPVNNALDDDAPLKTNDLLVVVVVAVVVVVVEVEVEVVAVVVVDNDEVDNERTPVVLLVGSRRSKTDNCGESVFIAFDAFFAAVGSLVVAITAVVDVNEALVLVVVADVAGNDDDVCCCCCELLLIGSSNERN